MTGTTTPASGATGGSAPRGRRRGAVAFWLGLAGVLLLVAVIGGPPSEDGEALAPDATGPSGAKALVLLLEELGADVDPVRGAPSVPDATALLLQDGLDEGARQDLRRWVEDGGTLVVADPSSPFAPLTAGSIDPFGGLVGGSTPPGECDIDALGGLGRIDGRGGLAFEVDGSSGHCFGDDESAFVVVAPLGAGTVVAVGGAGAFTNEALGILDNAVLAGALLAPTPGGSVAFIERPEPPELGSGDRSLGELVAPGVKAALFQLVIAFVVYALWRARRLGHPVDEHQPVQIAGSELVGAVGELLQQTRSPERAAQALREDLRRALCAHLGLAVDTAPDVVAAVTARRTGADAEAVHAAIAGPAVTSDHELVTLAQTTESIRKELFHGIRT